MIKKILFVTKFEELGFDAIKSLLSLRESGLEHIVFMYVIEREKVSMRRGVGYQKDEAIRLKEAANIRFIDWAERLFELGMEVGVYIQVGSMAAEVAKAARKEEADLVVIGRSGKTRIEQFYSGSTVTETHPPAGGAHAGLQTGARKPLRLRQTLPAAARGHGLVPGQPQSRRLSHQHEAAHRGGAGGPRGRRKRHRGLLGHGCPESAQRHQGEDGGDLRPVRGGGIAARSHVYVGTPAEGVEKAARECLATVAPGLLQDPLGERWRHVREIAENRLPHVLIRRETLTVGKRSPQGNRRQQLSAYFPSPADITCGPI